MRVLLFSGGIDSTCLAWAHRPDRLAFIDYGQIPAAGEKRACKAIAAELGIPFDVHKADLLHFGSGAMAGTKSVEGSKPEFWPYRNQMLITLAAMAYSSMNISQIMIGTVRTDNAHSDGRAAFIRAMQAVLKSQSSIVLLAPAARQSTATLIRNSGVPLSVLGWTFSCHTGEWACGQCRGCVKHHAAMSAAERSISISDAPAAEQQLPAAPN